MNQMTHITPDACPAQTGAGNDSLTDADITAITTHLPNLAGHWDLDVGACDDGTRHANLLSLDFGSPMTAAITVYRQDGRVFVEDQRRTQQFGGYEASMITDFASMGRALRYLSRLLGTAQRPA